MTKDKITISNNHLTNFQDVLNIIETARAKAYQAVNYELIDMYWLIGERVSLMANTGAWGNKTVKELASQIQNKFPSQSGFSWQNIYRMKQFYETYKDEPKFSALLRKLSWTSNVLIMSTKTKEEREFYLTLTIKNRYSSRELERQIESGLYERSMLSKNFNPKELLDNYKGLSVLRDSYVLEFLDLPQRHKEKDLRKAIVANLKNFILEFGKDFAFVGEEYRVQVGLEDFYIDLLFENREYNCLVAVELKTEKFRATHIGQMQFYLEALDRDVRKENENPSIGLLLCAGKDDVVVEYTMSRCSTPSQIATYSLALPNKELLEQRVKELIALAEIK